MALASTSISVTGTNRVIALVDMDCFYVQVEERENPAVRGTPAAVVQYRAYKGGGIIAVNYEARAKGVKRGGMMGDEAKVVCPELTLFRVPETRGKADLTKYRDAGREVINVLTDFSCCVERASIDEAYIDLTEAVDVRLAELTSQESFSSWGESVLQSLDMEHFSTNYVLGHDSTTSWFDSIKDSEIPSMDDIKLAIGAEIVGKMREAVYQKTSFRCSAGIAHNKVVAKLVCGINKPNKQTILPHSSIPALWSSTKIGKVRGLGGKMGDFLTERLNCVHMSDLGRFTEKELSLGLGSKTGAWLYQLSLGFDDEAVVARQLPKSIGCSKNYNGQEALRTREKVKFWITQLATEVAERLLKDLEMNNRRARTLTLHVKFEDQNALSRSLGVHPQYNPERMAADAFAMMEKIYQSVGVLPVNTLGLIASKFEDEIDTSGYAKINEFFKAKASSGSSDKATEKASSVGSGTGSEKTKSSSAAPTIKSFFTRPSSSSTSSSVGEQQENQKKAQGSLFQDLTKVSGNKPATATEVNACFSTTVPIELPIPANTNSSTSSSLLNTPAKKSSAHNGENPEEVEPRKPFFSFSEATSPRKSPRKLTSSMSTLRSNEGQPGTSSALMGAAGTEKECERCGKKLNLRDYASHMDYHFAKDLSREINGLPPLDFDLRPETLRKKEAAQAASERAAKASLKRPGSGVTASGSKRGRGRGRGAKSVSIPTSARSQTNTIDSYFGGKD